MLIMVTHSWNTWNRYNVRVNENLIYDSAKAIKAAGLLEFGYNIISVRSAREFFLH